MIVVDESKSTQQDTQAGPSNPPPPTFEESIDQDHVILEFQPAGAPPAFAPYAAEFVRSKQGHIISHDPHLNEDGEALYRFLLSQASTPPTYLLHCKGTHDETRTRVVSHTNSHGRVRQRSESYTETVTDFDFSIDIARNLPVASSGPVHWSVPDSEPAYRGKMVKEVELSHVEAQIVGKARRKANRHENKLSKAWEHERTERGLPPWIGNEYRWHGQQGDSVFLDEGSGLRSSKTLRTWADEYCASPKHLKEFTYEKVIHGWNIDALRSAIRTTITSTSYSGNIFISFEYEANKIYVRPDNRLSRIISKPWLYFLMWILLIYPFVWLYKRFHAKGGGRWEVCGGAYALKRLVPADEQQPAADSKVAFSDQPESSRSGSKKVVGLKEGQWLRQWEGSIKRAVATHLQTAVPLTEPQTHDQPNGMALLLDGYTDDE